MTTASMCSPPAFLNEVGEKTVPWKEWSKIFETYIIAIGGDAFRVERKYHILLHNLGIYGRKVFQKE